MDLNENIQAKVGVFVAFGIIIFLLAISLLGGDRAFFTDYYKLHARFSSTQGLASGSIASLAGVNVGNVSKVHFEQQSDQLIVTMAINSKYKNRITENSVATIKTQGALGDRYVYIEPGTPGEPALKKGDFIPTKQKSGLLDVISSNKSQELLDNLIRSSKELSHVLKDLRGSNEKEDNLKNGLRHFSSIMRKIDKGEGTLGAVVNDPSIHDKISSFLGEEPRKQYLKPLIRATIQNKNEDQ